MNIVFSEHKSTALLQPFVQCYWHGKFNIENRKSFSQSVVPNGCIELIIHLDPEHCHLSKDGNQFAKSPEFMLMGLYTKPYEVQFDKQVSVFGIRFNPDGIRNIFGIAPGEFLTTYENSVDILGIANSDFCSRIREQKSLAAQIDLANSYLMGMLARNHRSTDYTHQVMQTIRASNGLTDLDTLGRQAWVSDRQLQREFKKQYGITVKEYLRLSRMNAVQKYMTARKMPLTALSYELEFSDQSHFIREFKNYTGVAPRSFLKNRENFIVNSTVTL